MFGILANETIGAIQFPKLDDFQPGEPQRNASQFTTLTGATIHQVTSNDEADRIISFTAVLSRAQRDTLLSLHNSSTLIHTLQTGEEVYKGWFNCGFVSQPSPWDYRYAIEFHVTEKER